MGPPIISIIDDGKLIQLVLDEIYDSFPKGISRILLVMPPDMSSSEFDISLAKRGRYRNYAAYGLGILASRIRSLGLSVSILNLNHEILRFAHESTIVDFDFEKIARTSLLKNIQDLEPEIVGMTCMFSQTHKSLKQIHDLIYELRPNLPMVGGGVHITNSFANSATAEILARDLSKCKFFFRYEGDNAFVNFLLVANKKSSADSLSQLVLRDGDKLLELTGRSTPVGDDLDTIPAHDLLETIDLSRYGNIGAFYCHKPLGTCFTTVLSNRGCRGHCTFCSVRNFNGTGVRRRSVSNVIEELKMLRYDYGVDHIMWLDDDFLYDKAESLKLFSAIIKENLGITWDCSNGVVAASCTDELMTAAEESGCIGLLIGMESGSRRILREVKKPGTVEIFLKAAEVLRKRERINSRVFLMIGFPHETYREIYETIVLAKKMNLDWYNIAVLQPLPNTPIYESLISQGLIDIDFDSIRWNTGSIGKGKVARSKEIPRDLNACDFKDAFVSEKLDSIPSRPDLDDIWAYMNYHLNFNNLMFEERPAKLKQHLNYLKSLYDIVVPENVFAMYYLGYLQSKLFGSIEDDLVEKLRFQLANAPYWKSRFDEFGLNIKHLEDNRFPVKIDHIKDSADKFGVALEQ